MKKNILSREEFLEKVNIDFQTLRSWESARLVKPAGFTEEGIPFYSERSVEQAMHIQNLINLGYGASEIKKIIKKVGLPNSRRKPADSEHTIQYLTVGNLAERAGVSPRTIKHWEDKGIIEPDMRSDGGFRLYPEVYVYLCNLIKDLQLFGYTLEQIKVISDFFRDFLTIRNNSTAYTREETSRKLDDMQKEIAILFDKMDLLKEGIQRWEDLLKKKKKEILSLENKNKKRLQMEEGSNNA